ncbi:MAP kinase-activating death domain protein, variant 2, partial [Clonorchis sinensis]
QSGNELGQIGTEPSEATAENWASLTTFCLISHHPFFSKFRKCLHLLKHLVDSAQLFLDRTTNPSRPGQIWSLMTGVVTDQMTTDAVCQRLFAEIETWIFRLLSTPAPLPERSCVYYRMLLNHLLFFTRNSDITKATKDFKFPLHLPLELLGVQTCLKVLTAIMLEQKVILQSRDYNALTMSVMAFTAMLYPLQYMFPAIPLLPTNLDGAENLLLSPTPFLIGIPANFLSQKKAFYIPPDVWLVDLDTNRLMGSSSLDPIPPLPQKEGQELVRHLEHALTSMSSERPRSDNQSAAGQSQASEIDLQTAVDDVDSVDVATRVAMVRFFNSPNVLANLSEHTRNVRLYPRPVVAFQYYSFLKSRQTLTPFIRRLAQTQAVEFLSEWSIYPENEVFQRIHAGITDASLIGDKAKWFASVLPHIPFNVWLEDSFAWLTAALEYSSNGDIKRPMYSADLPDPASCYSPPLSVEEQLQRAMMPKVTVRTRKKTRPTAAAHHSIDKASIDSPVDARSLAPQATIEHSSQFMDSSAESSSDIDDTDIWDLKQDVQTGKTGDEEKKEKEGDAKPIDEQATGSSRSRLSSRNTEDVDKFSSSVNGQVMRSPSQRTETVQKEEEFSAREKLKGLKKIGTNLFGVGANKREVNKQMQVAEGSTTVDGPQGAGSLEAEEEEELEEESVGKILLNNLTENLADAASQASSTITGLLRTPKRFARTVVTELKSETSSKKSDPSGANTPTSDSRSPNRLGSDLHQIRHLGLPHKTPEQNSSDQAFLRDVVAWVVSGRNLGSTTKERLRELLSDENYRSYLMSKLNFGLDQQIVDPGAGLKDVEVQNQNVFDTFVSVLHCTVRGLEATCTNHGIGGLASAMLMLEVCHTHYVDQHPKHHQTSKIEKNANRETNSTRGSVGEGDDNLVDTLTGWFRTTAKELRPKTKDQGLGDKLTGRVAGLFSRANRLFSANENELSADEHEKLRSPKVNRPSTQNSQEQPGENRTRTPSASSSTQDSLVSAEVLGTPASKETVTANSVASPTPTNRYCFVNGQLVQENCSASDNAMHDKSRPRTYLYEMLIRTKQRSLLWDHMQFWEDMFFDVVAQERDILGLDQDPMESLERFARLNSTERKMLQNTEDRLLTTCLHNLVACQVMMRVDKTSIRNRVRRIQARCRLGSTFSESLSYLLDRLDYLEGNSIRLLPSATRNPCLYSTEVRKVEKCDEPRILQVHLGCILFRDLTDSIVEQWTLNDVNNVEASQDNEKLVFTIQSTPSETLISEYYCTKVYRIVVTK